MDQCLGVWVGVGGGWCGEGRREVLGGTVGLGGSVKVREGVMAGEGRLLRKSFANNFVGNGEKKNE